MVHRCECCQMCEGSISTDTPVTLITVTSTLLGRFAAGTPESLMVRFKIEQVFSKSVSDLKNLTTK